MIFSRGWPSWFWAARARGYHVSLILLQDASWKGLIKQFSPSTDVVVWQDVGDIVYPVVEGIFSDFNLKGTLTPVLNYITKFVVSLKALSNPAPHWQYYKTQLNHHLCGGVTTGSWIVHVYSLITHEPFTIVRQAQRDLSTVVDSMISKGTPCAPPRKLNQEKELSAVELRPGTFHGRGLIPWNAAAIRVVVPGVFSPTKWIRRTLTDKERLLSWDISHEVLSVLPEKELRKLLSSGVALPAKCCTTVLDGIITMLADLSPTLKPTSTLSNAGKVETQCHTLCLGDSADLNIDMVLDITTQVRLEFEEEQKRMQAATKADDAPVPTYLWDARLLPDKTSEERHGILQPIRGMLLRCWRRRTCRHLLQWLKQKYPTLLKFFAEDSSSSAYLNYYHKLLRNEEFKTDWIAGRDCIRRCALATWWDWEGGSRPFHWRWPIEYRHIVRDGLPPWFLSMPKAITVPQRGELDVRTRELIRQKLTKVRSRGYLEPGYVKALTSFFTVPKGDGDVRLVYNGTKSGLNDSLWAPWFRLPTVGQLLRAVIPGTYMADIDVGEQFLNFILHKAVRPYAGVDFTLYFPEELMQTRSDGTQQKGTLWERWVRCGMGFKPSPYNTGQAMLMAEEQIRGDPMDCDNIFHFDLVVFNLPGMLDYTPSKPWVFKLRSVDNHIAVDFFVYVDDVRTTGFSLESCWQCTRKVASMYNYFGIQDAPRKRRGPSLEAGPWAGSTVITRGDTVYVTVTVARWQKAKGQIQWIHDQILEGKMLCHKTLESYRGFLVYVSRTYPSLVPYLKGIHLTLDSWRGNRDLDGWRIQVSPAELALLDQHFARPSIVPSGAPSHVQPVPLLVSDIQALMTLFSPTLPPLRRIRPTTTAVAYYGFGDASGSGFGMTLQLGTDGVHYRHGQWSTEQSEQSSNYRELNNLILTIEESIGTGLLTGGELFLFTDNTTAESSFHRGTTSSRTLFDLILRMRVLQMHHDLCLHVLHVSGKRMQAQGTDGLSRGCLDSGVLAGSSMLSFVPLHQSALERELTLFDWVTSWTCDDPVVWLSSFGWYTHGHQPGRFVWCPPPAAADACLEQLSVAIHKRPQTFHIVVIPRLMTPYWRSLLGKICDLIVTIPLGSTPWPNRHFEPLLLGIYFPLTRHRPWRLRDTPLLANVASQLSGLRASAFNWGGDILRKLLRDARSLDSLSPSLARSMLSRN